MPNTMRDTLIQAVTKYDLKQAALAMRNKRRYYNRFAFGLYLEAVERVCEDLNNNVGLREALTDNFTGQLLDVCLKALEMDKSTDAEQRMKW
jgi:hypothetical protein